MALALLCVGGGTASAEPIPLANVEQTKTTLDGWNLKISLDRAAINSVPNMAAAPVVREGFITAVAKLGVEGTANMGVKTSLTLFAQIGCMVNVANGVTLTLEPTVSSSLPRFDLTPDPTEFALIPTLFASPNLTIPLRPGQIKKEVLGKMAYPPEDKRFEGDSRATDGLLISIQDVHMAVSECGGPVSIRLYLQGTMTTAKSFDSLEAYSDILTL